MAKIKQKQDGKTLHIEMSPKSNKFHAIPPKSPENLPQTSHIPFQRLYFTLLAYVRAIFLPEGFPKTVSHDYLDYQIWDSYQALCSSLTGTLSTHAILKGVGMGDDATAAAASVRWLIRDGSGMIGRILFTWWQGSNLDQNSKAFRLFADILNDVAIFIEIISPAFPDYFLLLICIGNLMKAIVGVAGGATRASFTEHQARSNNMADVSAKDASQETALGLVGLILGVIIIPFIAQSPILIWSCYFIFTYFHIYCNFKAVAVLEMETFNQSRFNIVAMNFLEKDQVLTPLECSKIERNFSKEGLLGFQNPSVVLGANFVDLIADEKEFDYYGKLYKDQQYFLGISKNKKKQIAIVLMEYSTSFDQLKAFFQYIFIRFEVNKNKKGLDQSLIERSVDYCNEHFDRFYKECEEKEWDTQKLLLAAKEIRVEFDDHQN